MAPNDASAARPPMSSPDMGVTKPAAGVMATMPATAPEARPTPETLPWRTSSAMPQAPATAAGARKVFTKPVLASPLAASALPPLKPSQPNQRSPMPRMAKGTLCGSVLGVFRPDRFPSSRAPTSAAAAALMCTTVPPAKSSTPMPRSQPPGAHTQCATGA
jgi:hypothetical protein